MGLEILEHTADIGFRATASSLPGVFEEATRGLCLLAGRWQPGEGSERRLEAEGRDRPVLLAAWLSEVLFTYETEEAAVAGVSVEDVSETRAGGRLWLQPLAGEPEGIQIKAITYHGLELKQSGEGWQATVYVDV